MVKRSHLPSRNEKEQSLKDWGITVYPFVLSYWRKENLWCAWYFDFGFSACSYLGDTPQEAIEGVQNLLESVLSYYKKEGLKLPLPSVHPAEEL